MGRSLNCRIPRRRSDSAAALTTAWTSPTLADFAQLAEQVDHRAIGHRHLGRDAVQLALSCGSTHPPPWRRRSRWDDIFRRRPAARQSEWGVRQALVVGVGVDRIDHALLDAKGGIQHAGNGCQAIGGAAGVGNNPVPVAACLRLPQHHGVVHRVLAARSVPRFRARRQVLFQLLALAKYAGGLHHGVNPAPPREYPPGCARSPVSPGSFR